MIAFVVARRRSTLARRHGTVRAFDGDLDDYRRMVLAPASTQEAE